MQDLRSKESLHICWVQAMLKVLLPNFEHYNQAEITKAKTEIQTPSVSCTTTTHEDYTIPNNNTQTNLENSKIVNVSLSLPLFLCIRCFSYAVWMFAACVCVRVCLCAFGYVWIPKTKFQMKKTLNTLYLHWQRFGLLSFFACIAFIFHFLCRSFLFSSVLVLSYFCRLFFL